MPTFNDYPARYARTFDLPALQLQAQQLKNARTTGQLNQAKLQEYGAATGRQEQLRGLMPGLGAEAGLGPKAQEVLAIDPSQLAELMKIPKADRDRAKAETERIGGMLQAVETAPGVQRPSIYTMVRQQYAASGADLSGIPETYDPAWVQTKLAAAGKFMAVLDRAEKAVPSGYQRTEGGLEFTPGGPADPAQAGRLAEAKRDPRGGDKPAMLQVADAYKQAMSRTGKKVSDAQALRWAKSSVNDTPQETWTKIYMANRRDITMDEDQARTIADEITAYVHGESFGGTKTPPLPAGGQASLNPVSPAAAATAPARSSTEVTVPIPPENGAPAPRRKPAREKAIEAMSKDEVVALIYGGRDLSQDEIDRLDARMKALGL